ncbi:MAG: ATP-binding protein [Microlunatus sp.]|nr:ATP-binding protein [Microlunatus sp.]
MPEDEPTVTSQPDVAAFAATFSRFLEVMVGHADTGGDLTDIGREVVDFLGVALTEVDPVVEAFPPHQIVDVDLALDLIRSEHRGRLVGVSGGVGKHGLDSFTEFLERSHWNFRLGSVGHVRVPTGPDSDRRVVGFGITLVLVDGEPIVWMQRTPSPQYGREQYTLEVLAANPSAAESLLVRVRALMSANSRLRGQVLSFQPNDFDYHAPGGQLTFLTRPDVTADQVILPSGQLDRIVDHVVGIGEHRNRLLAAGQHLKRGVLLYGPPGTGKTHIIRHLLSRTPDTTAVLLSGRTLDLLGDAARLARAAQPAIVVLEDCDLIAEERGGDTNAALFETLETLDGLDGDADVTFILTTNRPDLLERALAERPGRVDLAVQIAKPDRLGRLRLLRLYAGRLPLSKRALASAAERTEGVTASFAKEVVRRVVLRAARAGREVTDDDLAASVDDMRSDAELFTRVLLGSDDRPAPAPSDDRTLDEDDIYGGTVRWYPGE